MSVPAIVVPGLAAVAVAVAATRWATSSPPDPVRELIERSRRSPIGTAVRTDPERDASPGPSSTRRSPIRPVGSVLVGLIGIWGLGPVPMVALGALVLVVRAALARRVQARALAQRDRVVPDLIDLFVIAAAAGHTAHGCVHAVAPRAPQPVQPVMARASRRMNGGESIQVVLSDAGAELGPLGGPLAGALAAGAASGAPMAGGLAQVSDAAREARRRRAEEHARRLPVTLLFPLVLCILPAFLVLAVVPLLVGSLGSLQP